MFIRHQRQARCRIDRCSREIHGSAHHTIRHTHKIDGYESDVLALEVGSVVYLKTSNTCEPSSVYRRICLDCPEVDSSVIALLLLLGPLILSN